MNKVKEELLLSMIFVGKWIALGFGAVGILYFAINLAYDKSYFDPRMAKFDLEIEELTVHQSQLKSVLASTKLRIQSISQEIGNIKSGELAEADEAIEDAKSEITNLGLKWWEKIDLPLLGRNSEAAEAYQELENAEGLRAKAAERLSLLEEELESAQSASATVETEIEQYSAEIEEVKTAKKRAEVDVKGPLLWLAGVLGLT